MNTKDSGSIQTKDDLLRGNLRLLYAGIAFRIDSRREPLEWIFESYESQKKSLLDQFERTTQAEIDTLREFVVAFCGTAELGVREKVTEK